MTPRIAGPVEQRTPRQEPVRAKPSVAAGRVAADRFESVPQRKVSLSRGMTGPGVRALQAKLVMRGYLSRGDMATGAGVFGPRTAAGVQRLQAAAGLPTTGVVDARTLAALAEPVRTPAFIDDPPTDRFAVVTLNNRLAETVTDDEPTQGALTGT